MKKVAIGLGIAGALILILGFVGCGQYNSLIGKQEAVQSSWAQVENVLQRRADLIPNLVSTVKGYASHEKEVFTNIADARSKLAGASTPKQAAAANQQLNSALSRLLVVVERYPDLKANQSFGKLMNQLEGTENRIATERRRYNDAVKEFNLSIKKFPGALFAGMMGFSEAEYFEAEAGAEEAPEVNFET